MEKQTQNIDRFSDLEQTLQHNLFPVSPNPDFILDLKEKLAKSPVVVLEKHPVQTTVYLIFAFGLFIGVFIFWLIRLIVRSKRSRITDVAAT